MWPFKTKAKEPAPLAPFIPRMRQKDPALFSSIQHMAILKGIEVWRQTYPEDFTDLSMASTDPRAVVLKPR